MALAAWLGWNTGRLGAVQTPAVKSRAALVFVLHEGRGTGGLAEVFLHQAKQPGAACGQGAVESFDHEHALLAEGGDARLRRGQDVRLEQAQAQPLIVDRGAEVRLPAADRADRHLEDVCRGRGAARLEPFAAPAQEGILLLSAGQRDPEVVIGVLRASEAVRGHDLEQVAASVWLCKRVRLTIRQLGYPTKNALKSWHREYEQRLELPAGYARQPKFSQAQKEQAVSHYLENGCCYSVTIRALGYPSRTLLPVGVRELHPELEARVVGRSRELSPEMKQAAVVAVCMRQSSAEPVAKGLGVSRPSLYNWKTQLLGHDAPASMKHQQDPAPNSERSELEQQLASLRRDIRRLQLEQDLLKKANELLKKDLGIDRQLLTNREKSQLVDALRATYTLTELLQEIGLPRSSYFYHRARLEVADKYVEVRRTMADIFQRNYRCYGYRRMQASLTQQSMNISEKVVRRLMKQESLIPFARRRRRYGSYTFLDESHRIKSGVGRQTARAVLGLSHLPVGKLIMSGTPMPQAVDDLIPQFSFLYPEIAVDLNRPGAVDAILGLMRFGFLSVSVYPCSRHFPGKSKSPLIRRRYQARVAVKVNLLGEVGG